MINKIIKSILFVCCIMVALNATSHRDWEYESWTKKVKNYVTEPNFSLMPNNILESYRFVESEGWGGGYTKYIRISKIKKKDSLSYVIDSANIGYYSNKKRIHAMITKKEWKELRNAIDNMLSYNLESRDKRKVFDAGSLLVEVYKNEKKFYIWRYNIHTKKDSAALRVFYRAFSDIDTFNTKSIVKNKQRDKQVYSLQEELDEQKKIKEKKRQQKYALEAKERKVKHDSEQLWKAVETGAVGGIGYFKGINANIKNEQGQTPLMVAVKNEYTEVVRALGEAIVNVREIDDEGKTAFDYIKKPMSREDNMYSRRMYGALRVVEVEQIVRGKAKIVQYSYKNDTDILSLTIKGAKCEDFVFPENTQCSALKASSKHPIFKAIKDKNNTEFDKLLSNLTDLSIRNNSNYTPLWASIHYHNFYALEKLLDAGADMYALDQFGLKTPVFWATMINDAKLLKVLLKHGADVDSKDAFGSVALSNAMYKCSSFDTIAILLEHGANPYLKDKYRKTIFEKEPISCKDKENIERMKKLLHSKDGEGLKSKAVELNRKAKMAYLEEEKIQKKKKFDAYLGTLSDINSIDSGGFTPLHKAVATKDYYAMKKLIEKGADVHKLDGKYGVWTPFNYTIAMNDVKALKIFLVHGVDVNFHHKGKSTVLNDAIRVCNVEMVKLLLENGANPRLKDGYGGTVVSSLKKCDKTVKKEVTKLVNNVIKKGKNNTLQTIEKVEFQAAVEERKNKNKVEKTKAYVKSKKNTDNPILEAIRYKNNIDFDKYLKTLDNIDLKDASDNTLLYIAVEERNYYAIKKLLAHGANMYYINDYRTFSPFSYTVGLSDTRAVKLFVNEGVDVNHQYKKSFTALSLAVKQCNIAIIKLLLESGANTTLEDKRGDNAVKSLGYCNEKNNKIIKDLIIKKGNNNGN